MSAWSREAVGMLSIGLAVAVAGCDRQATGATLAVPVAEWTPVGSASAALVGAPEGAAGSLATAATHEAPAWKCDVNKVPKDELVIFRVANDGQWVRLRLADEARRLLPGQTYTSLLSRKSTNHVCAFSNSQHAWVAVFAERLSVLRTIDGGRTWAVSVVDPDPDDDTVPIVEMQFRDAQNGKVRTIKGGGHGNDDIERVRTFKTTNGGQTWKSLGERCQKFGRPHEC